MTSKNIEKVVKTIIENGDGLTEVYRDLARVVSLQVIKLWIKKINNIGSIDLSSSSDRSHTARTKPNISKAKQHLDQKHMSIRRLVAEMKISKSSIHRILCEGLSCFPYNKVKQPKLADLQKRKRIKFANWVLNNYTKNDITSWLFADENYVFRFKWNIQFLKRLCGL